jgi:hypothetical protein
MLNLNPLKKVQEKFVAHSTKSKKLCHCPVSPEKGDPSARELLRRADSTGPVSPTCFDL